MREMRLRALYSGLSLKLDRAARELIHLFCAAGQFVRPTDLPSEFAASAALGVPRDWSQVATTLPPAARPHKSSHRFCEFGCPQGSLRRLRRILAYPRCRPPDFLRALRASASGPG